MARTTFSRTVVKTICEVTYIDQNNDTQEAKIELFGNYDLQGAQKPAIKALNAKGGVVRKIHHKSYYGSMTLEKFDKFCDKKNYKEW